MTVQHEAEPSAVLGFQDPSPSTIMPTVTNLLCAWVSRALSAAGTSGHRCAFAPRPVRPLPGRQQQPESPCLSLRWEALVTRRLKSSPPFVRSFKIRFVTLRLKSSPPFARSFKIRFVTHRMKPSPPFVRSFINVIFTYTNCLLVYHCVSVPAVFRLVDRYVSYAGIETESISHCVVLSQLDFQSHLLRKLAFVVCFETQTSVSAKKRMQTSKRKSF